MADTLYMRRGDLQPFYKARALNSDGTPINLTGATIYFTMFNTHTQTNQVSYATSPCTITNATSGDFEYQWTGTDTSSIGKCYAEFEINPAVGGKFTLPAKKEAHVIILDDLDKA